jgi:glutathione S-transferase
MRSLDIAQELEKCYPTPSLHLDQNLHQTAEEIETKNIYAVAPDFLFNAWKDWVNPDAKDWYAKDRAARFGMPLQVLAEKAGGEQCLPASNAALEQLKQFLKEHKRDDGPFILGSTLSYGDFVIVALLEALSRIAKGHFEIMLDYDDSIRALYNACRPWAKRDD